MLRTIYAHLLNMLPEPVKLVIFRHRMRKLREKYGPYSGRNFTN